MSPASGTGTRKLSLPALVGATALLCLGILVALSLSAGTANATYPGVNGKIACEGIRPPDPFTLPNADVFTINPDGSDEKVLASHPLRDGDPAISPDGKSVVFESFREVGSEAWRMDMNGGNLVRLTTNGTPEDRGANWTPDSKRIYFHSTRDRPPNTNWDIYAMNADGSGQTRLTDDPQQDTFPELSPDGKKVVFNSTRIPGNPDIYTMNVDGTDLTRLTTYSGEDAHPSWSPDGKQIAFHTRRPAGATLHVWKMNADGSDQTRVTPDLANFNYFPDWSPDGKRIVFNAFTLPNDQFDPGGVDVYHVSVTDPDDVFRITRRVGFDGRCGWGGAPRAATPVTPPPAKRYPLPVSPPRPRPNFPGCGAVRFVIVTGGGNDVGNGTPSADLILTNGGNDVVDALAGDDCLDLGTGDDRGQGGPGNDLVHGGLGADTVSGAGGNDRLSGQAGKDSISGSGGRDRISGGGSGDRISGGGSADRVAGDSGNDRINGSSSADSLKGNSGRDRIKGGSGRDKISGGSGGDTISARDKTRDRISCGSGRDRVTADRKDRVARDCERVRRR